MDADDPQFQGRGGGKPRHMPFGVIHFRLRVNPPGAAATVRVHFSEPVPADSQWYKFDPIAETWSEYPGIAATSSDGKSVTLTIADGGAGDLDGTANGVIIDPSGIGIAGATSSAGDILSDTTSDSAGWLLDSAACFIAAAAHGPGDAKTLNFSPGIRSPRWIMLLLCLSIFLVVVAKLIYLIDSGNIFRAPGLPKWEFVGNIGKR
jgi:hypothetical protein